MTISMERARECVGRPVLVETDDGETRNGVIQYVGRSYIKVLIEGQEDGWVMQEEAITWKPLLPDYIRDGIRGWEEESNGGWYITFSDTEQTMILQRQIDNRWQDYIGANKAVENVFSLHPEADIFIAREVQELLGLAKP